MSRRSITLTFDPTERFKQAVTALMELAAQVGETRIEVLLSCTEAARLLGVSQKTISEMLKDGRLSKITLGKSTGILLSDVMSRIAQ